MQWRRSDGNGRTIVHFENPNQIGVVEQVHNRPKVLPCGKNRHHSGCLLEAVATKLCKMIQVFLHARVGRREPYDAIQGFGFHQSDKIGYGGPVQGDGTPSHGGRWCRDSLRHIVRRNLLLYPFEGALYRRRITCPRPSPRLVPEFPPARPRSFSASLALSRFAMTAFFSETQLVLRDDKTADTLDIVRGLTPRHSVISSWETKFPQICGTFLRIDASLDELLGIETVAIDGPLVLVIMPPQPMFRQQVPHNVGSLREDIVSGRHSRPLARRLPFSPIHDLTIKDVGGSMIPLRSTSSSSRRSCSGPMSGESSAQALVGYSSPTSVPRSS